MKDSRAYVLYANDRYHPVVTACAKSIRAFSQLPIYVYMLNSDAVVDVPDTRTIKWPCDTGEMDESMYIEYNSNFYIRRDHASVYKLLIQRPMIVRDALERFADTVAYVDSDSIATPYVDTIFSYYSPVLAYPYFVEGIYDFLMMNGRGHVTDRSDLSGSLEHPACVLFDVNQCVRVRYRQTGYFVAGQGCFDFLDEWHWMCLHPRIIRDIALYAPFNEETIANVLLWKLKKTDGLPLIYVNGGLDMVDRIYNEVGFTGQAVYLEEWKKIPATKEQLLFFHNEKRVPMMNEMVDKLKQIFGV